MGTVKKLLLTLIVTSQLHISAENTELKINNFLKDYPQLSELINQSWSQNQQLEATNKEKMAAEALVDAAGRNWFPQFWANSSINRQHGNTSSTKNYSTRYTNSLNVMQPLWDSEIHYQTKTANSVTKQFQWNYLSVRNQLAFNVLAAYFDYQTKLQNQKTYKQIIKNAEIREQNVRDAVELGKTLKVDLLETQAKLLEKKHQLVEVQNEAKQALELINLLTNKKVSTQSLQKTEFPLLNLPDSKSLITMSLEENPELQRLQEKKKMYDHRYSQLKQELVPTVYASGDWGYSSEDSLDFNSEAENWSAGINLVWKFGDATRSSRRLAMLREKQAVSENIYYYSKQLPTEIRTASLLLKTIDANLKSLKTRIKYLNELYTLREERYKAGQITITDLTLSEEDLLKTQIDYDIATGEYNITAMQLWLLAGGSSINISE